MAEKNPGGLTHLDETGAARMVDVTNKAVTDRVARAGAQIQMQPETLHLISTGGIPKGDVLATARLAGIMAAKRTSDLIPLCHPLALSQVEVSFQFIENGSSPSDPEPLAAVAIETSVRVSGPTGVEMEALTAAAVAALTLYDMCKAVDRGMVVRDIRLLEQTGGKSDYRREE